MIALDFMQPPLARPKYRDAQGRFRKETESELRARLGSFHYSLLLEKRRILKVICETSPWLKLLSA